MNENIDDLIANVMDSFDISHNPFSQNVPRYNNNNNHLPSNPNMRYVNRQIDVFNGLIRNYNENILEYQRNISQLITLLYINNTNFRNRLQQPLPLPHRQQSMQRQQQQSPPRQRTTQQRNHRPQRTATTRTTAFDNNMFLSQWARNIQSVPFNNFFQEPPVNPNMQPLTDAQIANSTNTFEYNENSRSMVSDTRCPISLETFQQGDTLCQIVGCGHVFKRPVLMNWLRRSSQCPICRYNLATDASGNRNISGNNASINRNINENNPPTNRHDTSANRFSMQDSSGNFSRTFTSNIGNSDIGNRMHLNFAWNSSPLDIQDLESDLLNSMSTFMTRPGSNLFDVSNNENTRYNQEVESDVSSEIEDNLSVDE